VPEKRLRVAELAAGLSVVSDLGMSLDDGQGIRSCVLAMRLADQLELDPDDRTALFWVGLLRFVGCTANASEMAAALGDDLAVNAAFVMNDAHEVSSLLRGAVAAAGRRPDRVAGFTRRARNVLAEYQTASAQVAQVVGGRLGLRGRIVAALGQVFERWDGKGSPGSARGTAIDVAVRLWQVAHLADLAATRRGADAVRTELRKRSAHSLDPEIVRACIDAVTAMATDERPSGIAELLAAEPSPQLMTDQAGVDAILPLFGMIADFKAECFSGHSARVAELAAGAAHIAGYAPHDVALVRRAGWVHDVGRVGVSSAIWTKPGPLTDAEREQARLHPYYTARALAHAPGLAALAEVASAHHERLDGSGYPAGLSGAEFSPLAALLAAADAYVSAGEPRPHRPARPSAEQAFVILGLARDGRLPHRAVDAVIGAARNAQPSKP
jgi:HD-GYP domain-containing protein (c-di-GMP phosphodiesterase class II)